MKIQRSKNAKRNILAGTVNRIITTILPFIVQTIMIRTLGLNYVGIKGLFTSILAVLSLTELGVGSAIVFSMYRPIADDDTETLCALLNLYKKLYRYIGTAILILGILPLPFLPKLIHGTYPPEINIYLIYSMYLCNTVISYFLAAYKTSLLSAYQRNDILNNIHTAVYSTVCIVQIIVLLISKNFYLYLSLMILSTVLINLSTSLSVDKLYPKIRAYGKVDQSMVKRIKIKVAGLLVGNICGTTRNTFDTIFISMFIGLTESAMYTNYFYIISILNGFGIIIQNSLLAGIGNSIAIDCKEKNYDDMMKLNRIYMIIGGWMTVCLLCLYQPFMAIWVGENYVFPFHVVVLFPIYFYISKMGDIRGIYSDAAGLFWENRYRNIAEAVCNIILNYLFVKIWGVAGIIIATLITMFLFGFLASTYVIFKYYFMTGRGRYLLSHALLLIVTVAISVTVYALCSLVHGNHVLIFVVRSIICVFVTTILYYIAIIRSDSLLEALTWFVTIIRRK